MLVTRTNAGIVVMACRQGDSGAMQERHRIRCVDEVLRTMMPFTGIGVCVLDSAGLLVLSMPKVIAAFLSYLDVLCPKS